MKIQKIAKEEKVTQVQPYGQGIKVILKEEYENFYNQSGLNYDKPWKVFHNKMKALLTLQI